MKINHLKLSFQTLIFSILIFIVGVGVGNKYINQFKDSPKVVSEKNTQKAFISEVYDKIKENYWNNISDSELLDLFKLAMDKQGANVVVPKFENKTKFLDSFEKSTKNLNNEQKSQFTATLAQQVLSSLNPPGRSGLFTQKQEQQLKNTVSNIDPQKDLYKDLGLNKGASAAAVSETYKKEAEKLSKDSSPQSQEKLKQLTYAKEVLTNQDKKEKYDTAGIEPTIFTKTLDSGILYVQFKKFSPTSLEEFQKAFESHKDNSSLNALIFDLRGNIGGAIDATAYFLGFFLGKGQYAFDFYHKGEYLPFKTPIDKLASLIKFKQVVVLVDQNSQSSAEMLVASLKKYHIGVLVGVPTKGWGTVERVFPLENQISQTEKYSIFLVHSITLRDDNQPIEGRGVDPDINIKDPSWPQILLQYFNNQILVNKVQEILKI